MLLRLRQQLFTFGARRLTREFDLPLSHRALERIWRQHELSERMKHLESDLQKAVQNEDYENAAQLRDQIRRLVNQLQN